MPRTQVTRKKNVVNARRKRIRRRPRRPLLKRWPRTQATTHLKMRSRQKTRMTARSQCSKLRKSSVNAALALLQVLNKNLLPQPLLSSLHNSLLVRSLPVPRLSKRYQSKMLGLSLILEVPHLSSRRHPKQTRMLPTIGAQTGVTLMTRPPSKLSPSRMSTSSPPSSLFNNKCNNNLFSNNPSQQRTCLTTSSTFQQRRNSPQPSLQVALCPTDSNLIKWAVCNPRANLQTTPSKTSSVLTLPMVPSRTTTPV